MMEQESLSDAKKNIAKAMISRGVVLDPVSISKLKNIDEKRLYEIASTLNDLPEKDFDQISKNPNLFLSFFDRISQDDFYELKTQLLKEHGVSFYDKYLDLMNEKISSNSNSESLSEQIIDDKTIESSANIPETTDELESNERIIEGKIIPDDIDVIFHYEDFVKKREIQDFVKHFSNRIDQIGTMLKRRMELADALPVRRLKTVPPRDKVAVIGIVSELRETKNNSLILEIEDKTGSIICIASNKRKDIFDKVKDLTLDEVIGIRGTKGNDSIYIEDVIWPDTLLESGIKKSPSDISAVVISDIQYGNNMFLNEEFEDFIKWINGESGDETAELSKNVKYLIIAGDLVDGIGIYPGQDKEIFAKDIRSQFEGLAEYLKRVPKHIRIIAIPGNHDPVRLSEPQPVFPKDYAKSLYELENFYAFSNPTILKIGKELNFEGLEFLLYHGYSYDYYAQNIDSIRREGGYEAPLSIMKYLLKRRHLAPSHKSSLYIPDTRKDYLVIERIPDFFISGHIHRARIDHYKSTTLIMSSCWQGMTKFEEKMGHNPEPAKAFHINFKTRKTTMLDFERADSLHRGVTL